MQVSFHRRLDGERLVGRWETGRAGAGGPESEQVRAGGTKLRRGRNWQERFRAAQLWLLSWGVLSSHCLWHKKRESRQQGEVQPHGHSQKEKATVRMVYMKHWETLCFVNKRSVSSVF